MLLVLPLGWRRAVHRRRGAPGPVAANLRLGRSSPRLLAGGAPQLGSARLAWSPLYAEGSRRASGRAPGAPRGGRPRGLAICFLPFRGVLFGALARPAPVDWLGGRGGLRGALACLRAWNGVLPVMSPTKQVGMTQTW